MTLIELQKVLGARILIAIDETLTAEKKKAEMAQSQLVASLAKQMINNADVVLRADKLKATGIKNTNIESLVK
jgi:hypothetical protein